MIIQSMNNIKLIEDRVWISVFEGEEVVTPEIDPAKQEDPNKGQNQDAKKTFTQEEVNRFLADDKKKTKVQTETLIKQLEDLKKSKNLTDQEKGTLSARIEELQAQIMTKDQLLEKEKHRLAQEHQGELQRVKLDRDAWQDRYTKETIKRSIMDEAIVSEAYAPEQIVRLLQNDVRLIEETDAEGKGLGKFVPRVKFEDTDSEGKPTTLDLTVKEVIKRMKDLPERFGNLFKSGLTSGLGGTGSTGSRSNFDPNRIKDMDTYIKNRERIVGKKKK